MEFKPQESYDLDLDHLQEAYTQASSREEADLDMLIKGVKLVRGDFLEPFNLPDTAHFEDWIIVNQEIWHRRVNQVFDRLSQEQLRRGAHLEAAETLDRWLSYDSVSEIAHHRRIQLFYNQGKRTDALEAYNFHSEILCEKLGLDPNPDTRALVEKIRS